MAIKIFNAVETEYTGTLDADLIIGNNLGNFIDAGDGSDIVVGGSGSDTILTGAGDDGILGGGGDDLIDAGEGNDVVDGGSGVDFIIGADGDDFLSGGDGDDIIFGNDGDDVLIGGAGADVLFGEESSLGDETVDGNLYFVGSDDVAVGDDGNDTFVIGAELDSTNIVIEAGVSELDNEGEEARYMDVEENEDTGELFVFDTLTGMPVELEDLEMAEETETDVRFNIVTRPGSSAISTFASSIAGYNAVDTLEFTQSGEFETIAFTGIERIELASGVNITLSAEQLLENGETTGNEFLNAGTHIYGVAGGPAETVTLELEFLDTEVLQNL